MESVSEVESLHIVGEDTRGELRGEEPEGLELPYPSLLDPLADTLAENLGGQFYDRLDPTRSPSHQTWMTN